MSNPTNYFEAEANRNKALCNLHNAKVAANSHVAMVWTTPAANKAEQNTRNAMARADVALRARLIANLEAAEAAVAAL